MMPSSFIHADIFFFVSTIALVVMTVGFIIAFVYVMAILKNLREMTDRAKAEWVEIVTDVKILRRNLRDEGVKWKYVADLARNFFVKEPVKKIKKVAVKHK